MIDLDPKHAEIANLLREILARQQGNAICAICGQRIAFMTFSGWRHSEYGKFDHEAISEGLLRDRNRAKQV